MKTATFEEFVSFARTDAGMQERVTEALRSSQAVQAVLALATECGYALARDEVTAALGGALGDSDLEAIVGGAAPAEWFAEVYTIKKTPKRVD